jgi:membrane protein YqaA with SNARE-associated domain
MGIVAGWWRWAYGWWKKFRKTRAFHVLVIIWGVIFILLTAVVAWKPEPFIRLGYPGVLIFNMLSGPGMFLLPTLAKRMNILGLSFFSALGMAINDSAGWIVGKNGEEILPSSQKVRNIRGTIQKYGPWALLVWSLTPFPYDLIGMIAGYLQIPYRRYIIPTFLGKFIRFLLISSGILAIFGNDTI